MPCVYVDLKLLWFWTGPKHFWIWVKKQNDNVNVGLFKKNWTCNKCTILDQFKIILDLQKDQA